MEETTLPATRTCARRGCGHPFSEHALAGTMPTLHYTAATAETDGELVTELRDMAGACSRADAEGGT